MPQESAVTQHLDNIGHSEIERNRMHLFLIGFTILFLELACIRWFGTYVVFLQFFSNIVLIAAFLGMSIGCMTSRPDSPDWLSRFPWLMLLAVALAIGLKFLYDSYTGFTIDVGSQTASPQVVFFGTEYRDVDLATFVVPMEFVAGTFFVLVLLMFIGPGQVLGRCFDRDPDRIRAYTFNIAGSLAGILSFALAAFAEVPPIVWFAPPIIAIGYFLRQADKLKGRQIRILLTALALILITGLSLPKALQTIWSPYYAVEFDQETKGIRVNTIGHQRMVDTKTTGSVYSLIHLLQRDAGGAPFEDVLIIGAGSGNDLAGALRNDVGQIDAVEIDPAIARLGKRHHPNSPYDDPRVDLHVNDGRNFLRMTDKKYDLIVFALVDSLILHSSISSIRLESFLFTNESFRDVQRALKPGGVFVTYNFMRQGWIVHRISTMLEQAFGGPPIIVGLPNRERISAEEPESGFTIFMAGETERFARAFEAHTAYWLNQRSDLNDGVNAFGPAPPTIEDSDTNLDITNEVWQLIAPAILPHSSEVSRLATDNWPFLYLRDAELPSFYLRSVILMAVLGLVILYLQAPGRKVSINGRMFFLGAGFLLVETKAVVQLSLIFGSTWIVNSLVFASILIMILLANIYALFSKSIDLRWHYGLLFAALLLNVAVPLDAFLSGGFFWRFIGPCLLVLGPMFFAGVIFAVSFRASTQPDRDFGANIAGAVLGGFAEYLSMLLGFQYLLLIAVLFYALSVRRRAAVPIATRSP